jgi:hypothetical protein
MGPQIGVGVQLALSALMVGAIAIAAAVDGGAPPLRAAGALLICLPSALLGAALVLWPAKAGRPPTAPLRPAALAALGGLAWSPAAAAMVLLFAPALWPLGLAAPLLLPAGAAAAAGAWGLLPGWLRRALRAWS